jgi:hypothetical protein
LGCVIGGHPPSYPIFLDEHDAAPDGPQKRREGPLSGATEGPWAVEWRVDPEGGNSAVRQIMRWYRQRLVFMECSYKQFKERFQATNVPMWQT